eukprot:905738-Rhodomonas_salina.3
MGYGLSPNGTGIGWCGTETGEWYQQESYGSELQLQMGYALPVLYWHRVCFCAMCGTDGS